jgi:hypothetical protein
MPEMPNAPLNSDTGQPMTESKSQVRTIEYAAPPARRRSGLGIASFVLAIVAVGSIIAVFLAISGRRASDPLAYELFGLSLILPVVGTVFGIVSLCQRHRYRGLAVAGLTINAALTCFVLVVTVPSLFMR